MRSKADTDESSTALFREVKLNQGRPMAMAVLMIRRAICFMFMRLAILLINGSAIA
jgi:hypothetical protein